MKALLCKEFGPPENLVLEEVPDLSPGKGQVVVAVKACGVNFPDVLIIENKYQFKPPLPFSPGAEVAGVVKAVGEGVDAAQGGRPGDRVVRLGRHGRTGAGRRRQMHSHARRHEISRPARRWC